MSKEKQEKSWEKVKNFKDKQELRKMTLREGKECRTLNLQIRIQIFLNLRVLVDGENMQ